MGTAIVATDANRENAGNARVIPPVTRGLRNWLLLNDDLTKLQHNFLDGTTGASVVTGSPVVSATSTRFTGQANYLTLPFSANGDCTVFVVAKLPGAFTSIASAISDYASSAQSAAFYVAYVSDGIIRLVTSRDDGVGGFSHTQTQISGQDTDAWALTVATAPAGAGDQTIRSLTSGVSSSTLVTTNRMPASPTRNPQVGGSYNSGQTGEIDIAALIYHNVVLSETEIAKQAAFIRRYLTSRGISA